MLAKAKLMLKVSIFYGFFFIFGFHLEVETLGVLKNFDDPDTQAVFTRWSSIVYFAVIFSTAFWGIFFYEKSCKWVVFLCGSFLFWWLFRFHHFYSNASSILNARQIRSRLGFSLLNF
jgi:fatty acid desaturase